MTPTDPNSVGGDSVAEPSRTVGGDSVAESSRTESAPTLLQVEDLRVEFDTYGGTVQAVRGVSFSVDSGETLAIVGESGCGKSVTVQSIMGLIPMPPGRITSGTAKLRGVDIIGRKVIDGILDWPETP